jgi:hypothetical protein
MRMKNLIGSPAEAGLVALARGFVRWTYGMTYSMSSFILISLRSLGRPQQACVLRTSSRRRAMTLTPPWCGGSDSFSKLH